MPCPQICHHPKRVEIERHCISVSQRDAAKAFRLSQAAVNRHMRLCLRGADKFAKAARDKLVKEIEGNAQSLRTVNEIASDLERRHAVVAKLLDACEAELTGPDGKTFDLSPRAYEVLVDVFEDGPASGKVRRERVTAAELLRRAQAGAPDGELRLVEARKVDTRQLLRQTAATMGELLERLAKVVGILRADQTLVLIEHPDFLALRARMRALADRLAGAETLTGAEALAWLEEAISGERPAIEVRRA